MDELDANLHPLMMRALTDLFHKRRTNPRGAQLVMMTHDVTLLDKDRFRRDQIWLIEKNRQEESQLYSLVEFKGVRKDMALLPNYLRGRFGAVPYVAGLIDSFEKVLDELDSTDRHADEEHDDASA